jgi:hypothetical protein
MARDFKDKRRDAWKPGTGSDARRHADAVGGDNEAEGAYTLDGYVRSNPAFEAYYKARAR